MLDIGLRVAVRNKTIDRFDLKVEDSYELVRFPVEDFSSYRLFLRLYIQYMNCFETMADLRYSGTTLATTVLVLGCFTLAIFLLRLWFRITRRKYDASDTLLSAAVVRSLPTLYLFFFSSFFLPIKPYDCPTILTTTTNQPALRYTPKRHLPHPRLRLRLRQPPIRHPPLPSYLPNPAQTPLPQPNRLQTHHAAM